MLSVLDIQRVTIKQKLLMAALLLLGVFMLGGGRAQAATLTVAVGTDETTTNSSCSLSEAIGNINDQAATNTDCAAGNGTNDTINIPAGTITLVSNLDQINVPITIVGAGMGQTIISGDNGQYKGFQAETTEVTIQDLTVTQFYSGAIEIDGANTILSNIEIDGAGIDPDNGITAISVRNNTGDPMTLVSDNIYIHNVNVNTSSYSHAFVITGGIDADVSNTTLADFHSAGGGGVNGIAMHLGTFGDSGSNLNVNITNTTIDDVTSEGLTAPFAGVAFAQDEEVTVDATITNITITGTRGMPGSGLTAGLESAAFYAAGAAFDDDGHGVVTMHVSNSLMADNQNNGSPSNCAKGDLTPNVSGLGTVDTDIVSDGHNIADDTSCTGFNQPGDQQSINNIISTLGVLQDNGGEVPTRALLAGSPAIGAGAQVLGISTDARGVARTNGWDVGAYQSNLGASTVTPSGSNGGAGNLADTGQNAKTSILVGILLVSTAIATTLTRRKFVYKRR